MLVHYGTLAIVPPHSVQDGQITLYDELTALVFN